jgi:hypothetical protein
LGKVVDSKDEEPNCEISQERRQVREGAVRASKGQLLELGEVNRPLPAGEVRAVELRDNGRGDEIFEVEDFDKDWWKPVRGEFPWRLQGVNPVSKAVIKDELQHIKGNRKHRIAVKRVLPLHWQAEDDVKRVQRGSAFTEPDWEEIVGEPDSEVEQGDWAGTWE